MILLQYLHSLCLQPRRKYTVRYHTSLLHQRSTATTQHRQQGPQLPHTLRPSFSMAVDPGQSRLHTVKEWKGISDSNVSTPITLYILRIIIIITASFPSSPSHPLPSPLHPHSHALIPSPTPPASNTRLALPAALQGPPSIITHFFSHIPHPSLHRPRMQTRRRRVCGACDDRGARGRGGFAVFAEDSKMLRDGSGWSAWGCEVLACIDVLMGSF